MRKLGLCTQNTPTHIIVRMYLHYCVRFTNSVNCIRFPMNTINGENCAGLPCVYMKLFNFEIQKCGRAHKPYFLMPGHIIKNYTYVAMLSIYIQIVCSHIYVWHFNSNPACITVYIENTRYSSYVLFCNTTVNSQ